MHPGVYLIHNDAPDRSGRSKEIIDRIDMRALREAEISIHRKGPTPEGFVHVSVVSDAPGAQGKLDEMFGPGLIRVDEAPMAQAC